jgi:hypothetical protein
VFARRKLKRALLESGVTVQLRTSCGRRVYPPATASHAPRGRLGGLLVLERCCRPGRLQVPDFEAVVVV